MPVNFFSNTGLKLIELLFLILLHTEEFCQDMLSSSNFYILLAEHLFLHAEFLVQVTKFLTLLTESLLNITNIFLLLTEFLTHCFYQYIEFCFFFSICWSCFSTCCFLLLSFCLHYFLSWSDSAAPSLRISFIWLPWVRQPLWTYICFFVTFHLVASSLYSSIKYNVRTKSDWFSSPISWAQIM